MKNGTLGTIEKAAQETLSVRLDDGRRITVDLKSYAHIDHGYAATVHKTQGMTVDHSYVLATPGLDTHSSYVALSRHRHSTTLHYGRADFADDQKLRQVLARERPKDMALDYRTSAAGRAANAKSDKPHAAEVQRQPMNAADTDRAKHLRAMVAARVAELKPTAQSMRDALATAARAIPRLCRGRDNGAER